MIYHNEVHSDKLTDGEYEVLYVDSNAEEIGQTTTKVELKAGVYNEHHEFNNNLAIDIDLLQVSNPLKPGKFQIIENSHVYIFD